VKVLATSTADGAALLFEVDDESVEQLTPAALLGGQAAGVGEATVDRLKDAVGAIVTICRDVRERLEAGLADHAPDEFQLQFGVTLAGEAGFAVITKASAQATLTVTATWKTDGS
jgi:Trypsin-co-occurring domain 1